MGEGLRRERLRDGSGKPAKKATFPHPYPDVHQGASGEEDWNIPLRPAGKEA